MVVNLLANYFFDIILCCCVVFGPTAKMCTTHLGHKRPTNLWKCIPFCHNSAASEVLDRLNAACMG